MKRICALAVMFSLHWGSHFAYAEGPPPEDREDDSTHSEFSQEAAVLGVTTLKVHFRGETLSMRARATSLEDEFMVVADSAELGKLARAFGAQLEWKSAAMTLVSTQGSAVRSLRVGQDRVEGNNSAAGAQQAELPLAAQLVDGAVHVPLSSLEELLGVRVTSRPGNHVYVEPLIRSVHFEGTSSKPRLVIEATSKIRYHTFTLKSPNRFVIDVTGAVLDTPALTVQHPDLGTIRLGQFELGPAISRIVVPMEPGIQVQAPRDGSGDTLAFPMQMPRAERVSVADQTQKIREVQMTKTAHGYKVVLDSDAPMRYEWQRLPDGRMFVDIPGVVLTDPKQEFELGEEYATAVRLSQNQPLPSPQVRLVIDMQKAAEVNVSTGESEDQLIVEILNKEADPNALAHGSGSTRVVAGPGGSGLIVLDAGHGGSDVGAQNKGLGLNEANVTLDITKRLATLLKAQGWTVLMTRTSDVDVSYWGSSAKEELGARVKVANDKKADIFLSVHCNASVSQRSNGTSIHYYKQSDYLLASELQSNVLNSTGRANRGLQANRFYVLVHSEMPAVLVETAFLTNPTEGQLLGDAAYRQKIADGLAQGLRRYATRNLNWAAVK